MLRKFNIFTLSFVLSFTVLISELEAQQSNKPVQVSPVTPSINPVPAAYGSEIKVNYIRTWLANGPFTDPNALISAGHQDAQQSTQYFDGLGRTVQTVNRQITPQGKDMVVPFIFDEVGRETYRYLPYVSTQTNGAFKMDPFGEQKTFMQAQFSDEQVYYSQTIYEASPIDRVQKSMTIGNSWAGSGRGISMQYLVNTNADAVRTWDITTNLLTYANNDEATNIPTSPGLYATGELYKSVGINENGKAEVEYKDKAGMVILKKSQTGNIAADYSGYTGFSCTYFVYDNLGQLRFVIPPKALELLINGNNNWTLTPDIINELCFRYEFDDRGRQIAKKTPGAAWMYMVYDNRDRLVFTQDGNQHDKGQWMCMLYDSRNRPVMTGIMTGYSGNRLALQNDVTNPTVGGSTTPGLLADLFLPNTTQTGPFSGTYQAFNSITLAEGFETSSGGDFTAAIVTGPAPVAVPEESILEGVTVYKNPMPGNTTFIALTKTYYDNYGWTNKTFTASYNGLLDAGNNHYPITLPAKSKELTTGLLTGSQVRVIADAGNLAVGNWLSTVNFYDEENRLIQVIHETQKGTDVVTSRYNFSGKVICEYLDHTNTAATPTNVHIKTNMEYDHAGRLKEIWKTINDDAAKKALIVKSEYNDQGLLVSKALGHKKDVNGNYTAITDDPIETIKYSHNIRGWLTGINKEYANGGGAVNGSTPWFGMELNYDKGFDKVQYNGNVAGVKWRSRGDGEQRAYGYTYDNLNRILGADFTQYDGNDYVDNAKVNFDMVMGDGQDPTLAYDANGNIKAMKQWGLKLNSSPVIDDLEYAYYKDGNRLRSVKDKAVDASNVAGGNWGLGDFTDNNKNSDDYAYDASGNMVVDLNKKLAGTNAPDHNVTTGGAIVYNFLNLPWKINAKSNDGQSSKGTITYIYDAAGNKLQKIVLEKNVSVSYNNTFYTTDVTTTSYYVSSLVYESKEYQDATVSAGLGYHDKLQFFSHEEGRTRYIEADETMQAHFEHDYFVKDHLGNIRMVLTEEQKPADVYQATMEDELRTGELALFGDKITSTEAIKLPGFDGEEENKKVIKLNGGTAAGRVGPGVILKVMAGDKIKARTYAWYQSTAMDNTTDNVLPSLLTNVLAQLAPGVSQLAHGATTGQFSNELLQPGMESLLGRQNPEAGAPHAYLNWVLLDEEQFKMVDGNAVAVPNIGSTETKQLLEAQEGAEIEIKKNGYLYVFVSNESKGDVYFDDLRVEHMRSPLIEETHYYPFGLTMAGISSKAAGKLGNKLQFNGKEKQEKEFSDGSGLELYDFGFRMHDPQTGRFLQQDPHAETYLNYSPFAFVLNNPVNAVDPDGRDAIFNISTDANGNVTITISSTIYITGDYASEEMVNNLNKELMDKFQSQTRDNVTIAFNVQYKYSKDIKEKDLANGENILTIYDKPGISHIDADKLNVQASGTNQILQSNGRKGKVFTKDEDGSSKDLSLNIFHESLHLLGLSDRYTRRADGYAEPDIGHLVSAMIPSSYRIGDTQYRDYFSYFEKIRLYPACVGVLSFRVDILPNGQKTPTSQKDLDFDKKYDHIRQKVEANWKAKHTLK